MTGKYDFIIVGAGIAGITFAERLANGCNKKVLLVDKRFHVGGTCYDYVNKHGNILHMYGPHIFHTNNTLVYNYLSQFTRWNVYNHKVLYNIDNVLVPVPFNLISIDKVMGDDSEKIKQTLLETYPVNSNVALKTLMESPNPYLEKLGRYIYENVHYKDYKKLYDVDDDELYELIDTMPPVCVSYDCRYYHDIYQAIPAGGYAKMFEKMLSHDNIDLKLETDYKDLIEVNFENKKIYFEGEEYEGHLIFTGSIDEFFDYKYGELPYRSSVLLNEDMNKRFFQDNATIYYPDEYHFRSITEFKYLTGQQTFNTCIQFDFPVKYNVKDPEQSGKLYPVNTAENMKTYDKYKQYSREFTNVTFIGRLAEYKMSAMDVIIEEILEMVRTKFKKM